MATDVEIIEQNDKVIDELDELEYNLSELRGHINEAIHQVKAIHRAIQDNSGEVKGIDIDNELDNIEGMMYDLQYDAQTYPANIIERIRWAKDELDDMEEGEEA